MSFRQVDQRYVSSEIALMEWSPTMDLIALATVQGEVLLHRLSWQKVWSLPSPGNKEEDLKVTAMAWRPDGKVLALAYNSGKIVLTDVENAETLHRLDIHCIISALKWVGNPKTNSTKDSTKPSFYTDRSAQFLPKFYSANKSYGSSSKPSEESLEDSKKLKGIERMNLLIVGTEKGTVHLYAFGMFPCGCINVSEPGYGKNPTKLVSVALSEDLGLLSMVMENTEENQRATYYLKSVSVPLLKNKSQEFKIVALKYGQIASLLSYLSATIRAITEAWEDILLEIDTKLWKYAEEKKRVSDGTISDDFLELLMFGKPSDALEKFLLHDLTENGLKKFGHSIELSYSNIQKLVLKKLQNVATALFYHMGDLKGIAAWQERFGELGLSVDSVNRAMSEVGSFLMKATEIQQVIDSSMKNFKAFFRWLYAVILRLSDESVPPEITKVTQQDLNFVAEFLKENFASEWDSEKPKSAFKLERVGQYLKNEDLPFPPSVSDNPWVAFLNKHPILKEEVSIFPYRPTKSLVQQHSEVRKTVESAFNGPWNIFHNSIVRRCRVQLYHETEKLSLKVSHITGSHNGYLYTVFTDGSPPCKFIYLLRETLLTENTVEGLRLFFGELPVAVESSSTSTSTRCSNHKVCDVKFYNEDTISLLLIEVNDSPTITDCPILLQLPLKSIREEMKPMVSVIGFGVSTLNGAQFVDKTNYKRLENLRATELAVSGTRKVSCVLFVSRRQVRLFEMDVDEEDEDQDETELEGMVVKDFTNPEDSVVDMEENVNENKENTP